MALGTCSRCGGLVQIWPGAPMVPGGRQLEWIAEPHPSQSSPATHNLAYRSDLSDLCPGSSTVIGSRHG